MTVKRMDNVGITATATNQQMRPTRLAEEVSRQMTL